MIVYNTTYHAHKDIATQFVVWLKTYYIPKATACNRISGARLTKVLNAEESDGVNYSLQFNATDLDTLRKWYEEVGDELVVMMSKSFGQKVAGFSTLLEEIDI